MRFPFLPRPSREELASAPLHAIVRDYPETLEDLLFHGVEPAEHADRLIDDFEDRERILDDLEVSTAWRPAPAEA